jgi:hypothetical protein
MEINYKEKAQVNQMQTEVPTTTVRAKEITYNPNDPKHAWKIITPISGETPKEIDRRFGTGVRTTKHETTHVRMIRNWATIQCTYVFLKCKLVLILSST